MWGWVSSKKKYPTMKPRREITAEIKHGRKYGKWMRKALWPKRSGNWSAGQERSPPSTGPARINDRERDV